MKKKALSLIPCIILFSSFPLIAQTYQRTYGNTGAQTGTCIQPALDGNYVITAMATGVGAGSNDFLLMKMNTNGMPLWTKTYGGTSSDLPYYVCPTADGGYILSGSTYSFGNNNEAYLVRTDSDGNLLWSKTVGGTGTDIAWFVLENSDGSFYTSGQTNSFGGPSYNGYLMKHDSGGNLLWTKVFTGTSSDVFYGMSKTSDGGLIMTGVRGTNSFGSSDIWLVRTDANGDTLWTSQYGRITEDEGWAVIQTADGGFALTGDMHKDTVTPGAHNAVLLKTDSGGNYQWAKLYGSSGGGEVGYDLLQTSDEGYTIMGNTTSYGQGSRDVLLLHTNSAGALVWGRAFGSSMQDDCWKFMQTADQGYIVVAGTENFSANSVWDIYLVKTDANGIDSCYESAVGAEEGLPFVQQRRGATIISGGNAGNPATVVNTVALATSYPCSFTTGVETETESLNVFVYPNPFAESATFHLNTPSGYQIKLLDVFGREVYASSFTGAEFVLKKGNLNPGIYFYRIESGDASVSTGKIVIE